MIEFESESPIRERRSYRITKSDLVRPVIAELLKQGLITDDNPKWIDLNHIPPYDDDGNWDQFELHLEWEIKNE